MELIAAIQAVADDARAYYYEFCGDRLNDPDVIEYVRETHDSAMVNGLAQAGKIADADLVDAYHFVLEVSDEDIAQAFSDETVEFIY